MQNAATVYCPSLLVVPILSITPHFQTFVKCDIACVQLAISGYSYMYIYLDRTIWERWLIIIY